MGYLSNKKTTFLITLFTLFLTGCSVEPEPLTKQELKKSVDEDLKFINSLSKPISKPITLDEAINRAINKNINNKIQILESALSYQQIDLVYYDMLPNLTTNAGYSARNNYAASASTTFENGSPSAITGTPRYSVSQEKERTTADISFSWNVLDFGLSYVRAQQQSDKYLMSKEKERKVVHNIVQEVRRTYYKSVSADALLKKIKPMMVEVQTALSDSRKIKKLRLNSPMQALSYQRDLLEVLRSLQTLERNLSGAKIQLAELMGLKAGTQFELAEEIKVDYSLPKLHLKLDLMEKIALENRPEILESRYKERISQKETTTAMLKMLPGINLNTGISYNDSEYLLNNDWSTLGTSISWNLLNIFKSGDYQKIAKTQIALAKEQKLAISMAVLSQVHMSVVDFEQAKKEYLLSKEYLDVAKEIFELSKVNNSLDISSKLVFIKENLNYILAQLRHSSSYANVQNSYGRVFASLGVNENTNKKPDGKDEKKMIQTLSKDSMKESKVLSPIRNITQDKNKKIRVKVAIAKANTYLRNEANKNSSYEVILRKGQKVRVLDKFMNENGLWIKTPYGYIESKYLDKTYISGLVENANLDKFDSSIQALYKIKTLKAGNLRIKAKWNSDKRYLIHKNKELAVYDKIVTKNGAWYKTKYGYISDLVVKKLEKK